MQINKIYILLAGFTLFFGSITVGQVPDPPIVARPESTVSVIARSFGDSIIIRWAPNSIESWSAGNAYGYYIFRYLIMDEKSNVIDQPVREQLNTSPIQPLSLESIKKSYSGDSYSAVVAQAIYGSSFNLDDQKENVSLISLATELSNRYSFSLFACDMSINAARSHGLIYTDRQVNYGEKYVYCIKPAWNDTLSLSDSTIILVSVNDTFSVPVPIDVVARFENKIAEISWEGKLMDNVFTAYQVERSDDQGRTFKKVNKSPIINTTSFKETKLSRIIYIDTVPQNDKDFIYRVRGITPFGEISSPSQNVKGRGKELIVGVNPMIIASDKLPDGTIKVNWEYPLEYEIKIKGFIVERSDLSDGLYEAVSDTLRSTARSFIDKDPQNINYYQVCAIGQSNYTYCSFPSLIQLPDSIPPDVPTGLSGVIDSLGTVKLQWNKNIEADFMSYKVYRSNHPTEEFVQVNPVILKKLSFIDTIPLNNLTGSIYYSVSAQDKNYNESARCVAIEIVKPDTIPPVSPKIIDYTAEPTSITLEWIPSSSSDIVKNVLYKREQGRDEWVALATYDSARSEQTYKDAELNCGTNYEYLILAVDKAGLESVNNQSIVLRTSVSRSGTSDVSLKLTAGENGKSIKIKCSTKNIDAAKILLYKSIDDSKYTLYTTIYRLEEQVTDTTVKSGHRYNYRVQVVTKSGNRLNIGDPVSIVL